MISHNLGYPKIGNNRDLKKAIEGYWVGRIRYEQLTQINSTIKQKNWLTQKDLGIDLIPSNVFSLYDQALDLAFAISVLPNLCAQLPRNSDKSKLNPYLAIARVYHDGVTDISAMETGIVYHWLIAEQMMLMEQLGGDECTRIKA